MSPTSWSITRISFVLVVTAATLGACASEGVDVFEPPGPDVPPMPKPPEADAGSGDVDADAVCTTDDCDFFPAECTPDALCPTGPFDPRDSARGLSWLTTPRVLVGRSPTDVWFVDSLGAYAHFDGVAWRTLDASTQTSARAFWLTPSGEVAVTDHGAVLVRGSAFATASEPSPDGFAVASIINPHAGVGSKVTAGFAPAGSTTMWLATDKTLWRLAETPEGAIAVRPGIDAARCALGCAHTRSIHGSSAKTLFAVGERGAVVRVDDADSDTPRLTPFNSGTTMGLWGVFAASDSDVWAVGGRGTIRHYDGTSGLVWQGVEGVPTEVDFNAVWGTSSKDLWVTGDDGVVLHFDGTAWSRVKIAGLGTRRPPMTAVWGTGSGKVYVAGQGIVLSLGGTP